MGEVINIKDHESNCYTENLSVKNKYNKISIGKSDDGFWFLFQPDFFPIEFKSRQDLAEFLWMAVRLVDSEGRWEKDEYVGLNY